MFARLVSVVLVVGVLSGCFGAADARCIAACTDGNASGTTGAYCSQTSVNQCLDACQVRIKDQSTLCQTCLVEKADFGFSRNGDSPGTSCNNGACTAMNQFGTCTYNENTPGDAQRCRDQLNPRREVACTAEFRPVIECAAVCTTKP